MLLNLEKYSRALVAIALGISLAVVPFVSGCGQKQAADPNVPPAPVTPPPWRLIRPEYAVTSYLYWISYAYRIGNSDVASMTFSPYEEVRVNSYVQFNKQENRLIDQRLKKVDTKSIVAEENTATVATHEVWSYRYISTKTMRYSGPSHTATYDATYTVVQGEDGLWRVDHVDAQAIGEVE